MTATRLITLGLLAVLPLACQKSALRAQKDAVAVQDKANQAAIDERGKAATAAASASLDATNQVAAARSAADKKIEAAHLQAGDPMNTAVSTANTAASKIIDTQIAADQQAKRAADAFQKARLELDSDVASQLDAIDKRTAAMHNQLSNDKHAMPNAANVKQVEVQSKQLRLDLQAFEGSIDSFQVKLEQRLLNLRSAVDRLEGKPILPEDKPTAP